MKKSKLAELPRSIDEITKEYQQVLSSLAQAEYMAFVHRKQATEHKERALQLNKEAAARNSLDAAKKEEEAKNVQS